MTEEMRTETERTKENSTEVASTKAASTESKTEYPSLFTVVMPAYNEAAVIQSNLLETADVLSTFLHKFTIIAVDDGSTDNTYEEMKLACQADSRIQALSYDKNRGKGYAIRTGILASKSTYTAFLDSDLELPPRMLKRYLKEMRRTGADIIIGSKLDSRSKLEYPWFRKIFSYGYYLYIRMLFHLNLKDTQTGIKIFQTEKIRPILYEMQEDRFSFDIEMMALASMHGLTIREMPVVVEKRRSEDSVSKVSVKQVWNMFFHTLKIKQRIKKKSKI